MFSWSTRRQLIYAFSAFAVLSVLFILPVFFLTYKAPSCSDGIQNQGEQGVDCGGPCPRLCENQALDLIIHWQRAFKVQDGVYNALAYVENPNLYSSIGSISYRFKLYDSANILIAERDGQTSVPRNKIFGIFEGGINTGNRIPSRTLFEFLGTPAWQKDTRPIPPLIVSNEILTTDPLPSLSAVLENNGNDPVYNIEVVAILYGASGNAVAVSKTLVDSVSGNGSAPLIFTWPEIFSEPATRVEFTYRILP